MLYNLFLILLLIFIAIFTLIAGISGAPSVLSPKKITPKVIKALKIKRGRIYYDLGAGDGRILKAMVKNNGVAIGFEYTPFTYLLAKLKTWGKKHKNIKVLWKNFYKTHYKHAHGIFCFLSPQAMMRLEEKFEEELKIGSRVVSYAFPLPNKKPNQIIKTKGCAYLYVYEY